MIDIAVKDLVKSFEIGDNLLDGLTFEVQEGQCVEPFWAATAAARPPCFAFSLGEIGYDEGEVYESQQEIGPHLPDSRYPLPGIRWRRCSVPPSGSFWMCGSGWRNWNPR